MRCEVGFNATLVRQSLKKGENIIYFTPTETGIIPFSCSMGMYTGKFIVVDDSTTTPLGATTGSGSSGLLSRLRQGACGMGGGCGGCGGGRKYIPTSGTTQSIVASETKKSEITTVPIQTTQTIKAVYTYSADILPNTFSVKVNEPVRLEIDVQEDGYGCMSTILIPGLYDNVTPLIKGRKIVMTFTPTTKGEYPITCAMGVSRGLIKVI